MSKKEKDRLEICEMFMAKANKDRCFFGIIKRWTDNDGTPKVFSKICMPNDGFICSQASNQKTLGTMLDEICIIVLDKNLHGDAGIFVEILGSKYFLN